MGNVSNMLGVDLPHKRRLEERRRGVIRKTSRKNLYDAIHLLDCYLSERELKYRHDRRRFIGPYQITIPLEQLTPAEIGLLGTRRPSAPALVYRPGIIFLYEGAIVAEKRHLDAIDRHAELLPQTPDLPGADTMPIRKRLVCAVCTPPMREQAAARCIEVIPYQPCWTRGLRENTHQKGGSVGFLARARRNQRQHSTKGNAA
jgi:hypothetical protein